MEADGRHVAEVVVVHLGYRQAEVLHLVVATVESLQPRQRAQRSAIQTGRLSRISIALTGDNVMERRKGYAITGILIINANMAVCFFVEIVGSHFVWQQIEVRGAFALFAKRMEAVLIRQPYLTESDELVKTTQEIVAMGGYLELYATTAQSDN